MFGRLHIEMSAYLVLGELLDGNGWTGAHMPENVAGLGTADS